MIPHWKLEFIDGTVIEDERINYADFTENHNIIRLRNMDKTFKKIVSKNLFGAVLNEKYETVKNYVTYYVVPVCQIKKLTWIDDTTTKESV